jgi:transglutaminase-like putative cysteine protease
MSAYKIDHETRYVYESTVVTSQHVAWLEPRQVSCQVNRSYELAIDPAPLRVIRRVDYFGNIVHHFELLRPHHELRVSSRGVVEVQARAMRVTPGASPAWEQVRAALRHPSGEVARDVAQFVFESPQVATTLDISTFARASFSNGRPVLEAAIALMHRIHEEFTFDTTATNPATPVSKVLADRRGVCQDFAHFQIACLRSLGLAARYVSGYLLTDPPPGQPRLIGADASHAWLSVYCPAHGWVDLDPTNDVIVDRRHVTIAWGRDYGDVTPLRGVLLGGDDHQLFVGVSVVPIEDAVAAASAVRTAKTPADGR